MNEAEWLTCRTFWPLLAYLDRTVGNNRRLYNRKGRLLLCGLVRERCWSWLYDDRSRRAIAISEQYADGMASITQLRQARNEAADVPGADELRTPANIAFCAAIPVLRVAFGQYLHRGFGAPPGVRPATERDVDLVKHIVGNPFRPHKAERFQANESTITHLAESAYEGEPCAFALHDALLEAGQADLAEHFREPEHPKGCWALDLILGKS